MIERCNKISSPAPCGVGIWLSRICTYQNIILGLFGVYLVYTCLGVMLFGCLLGFAITFGVASSEKCRTYATAFIKQHVDGNTEEESNVLPEERGCDACGENKCRRHDPRINLEPWTGLRIHKQLDQAIEDFYNMILSKFVSEWYSAISPQPFFLEELRCQLRYASSVLLRRAFKINLSKLIIDKLLPCALHHHSVWRAAQRQRQLSRDVTAHTHTHSEQHSHAHQRRYSLDPNGIEKAALQGPLRSRVHPAARNRDEELRYLKCVTTAIMPLLLRKEEVDNRVFHVLVREIFAGWVLLSLTDVLADPYILNTLIVLATDNTTMPPPPAHPNYKVEFLESFARLSESQRARRGRLLGVDPATLLSDRRCLYAVMLYMKTTSCLHVLQFASDIKPFQMKILNPDLTKNEEVAIFNEAWDLYVQYFDPHSPSAIPFPPSIVEEMRTVLSEGPANVKKLQTTKALYQSSNFVDSLMENIFIPKFLHSEEFYKMFLGPRTPTGYHKQMTKKSQEKLFSSAIRLGSKVKSAIRTSAIDGQILDSAANAVEVADAAEDMDILRYLDSLAEHTKFDGHDLTNWNVQFTDVVHREYELKRGLPPTISRVFTISVHRPPPAMDTLAGEAGSLDFDYAPEAFGRAGERSWTVERSEHDLHLLRAKLIEFHGETLLQELTLPSRRDNSPLETLRYKYEDFIQRLLQIHLLASSQLLHIFLTAKGDFAASVQRVSLGNGAELTNIYQSVAHRLRKEKGRHLDAFIKSLVMSCDTERYRNAGSKPGGGVEEAHEVLEAGGARGETGGRSRDIRCDTFGDNFHLPRAPVDRRDCRYQDKLLGFCSCIMYLLKKVLRAHWCVCACVGLVAGSLRGAVDTALYTLLNRALHKLLSQQILARLVTLGHEMLCVAECRARSHSEDEQRERARRQLRSSALVLLLGSDLAAVDDLLEMLQNPRLNKQLVYNLLDLCLAELFPELLEKEETVKTR